MKNQLMFLSTYNTIDAWVKKSLPSMATKRPRFTLRWHQKARARQRIDFTNPQIG